MPWTDDEGPLRRKEDGEDFRVDVGEFEGPLDLLLELARHHRIDLTRISMLRLAEQYLSFIAHIGGMRLEVAADYLVMAAWLTYLKSRIVLAAQDPATEPAVEELSDALAFRLRRLQAMREAAAQLMARNRLDRDVFERGAPEPLALHVQRQYADNLFDLLKAYAERRQRAATRQSYQVSRPPVWSIKEAREVLGLLIGGMDRWGRFDMYLRDYLVEPRRRRSVTASSFSASLEYVREGVLEMRQEDTFRPIYLRRRATVGRQ
ncbi:MAG: segregation/condensation protein A [Pseudomonadota bacterium]|nr:segregation/condensation protein A [Pseudomonadota bacterium]